MESQLILVVQVLVRTLLLHDEYLGAQAQNIVEFSRGQARKLTAEPIDGSYRGRVSHWLC